MNYKRRHFLACSIKTLMVISAGLAGLFRPLAALAGGKIEAFRAETMDDALSQLFPGRDIQESSQIDVGVHDLIENGAVVPVNIETSLPNVGSISIFADKNPNPLIAKFNLTPPCRGFISTRLKVAEPSHIIAVVESEGKLFSARKFVEVVAGGCG